MLASVVRQYGSPDSIKIEDVPRPQPGPGQVLIRVVCSSLSPIDVLRRSGSFRFIHPIRFPDTLGVDVSGIVEKIGVNCTRLAVGDRVVGITEPADSGCHAAFVCVEETQATVIPEKVSHVRAAALPCAGLTALQVLRPRLLEGRVQRVVINGAAGGVGSFALQLARHLGATTIGAIARENDKRFCESLGATEYFRIDRNLAVDDRTSFQLFFDVAAKTTIRKAQLQLLKSGEYVTTRPGPGVFLRRALNPLMRRKANFIIMNPCHSDLELLIEIMCRGAIEPIIHAEYPLTEIAVAHSALEQGNIRSKIVIRVSDVEE